MEKEIVERLDVSVVVERLKKCRDKCNSQKRFEAFVRSSLSNLEVLDFITYKQSRIIKDLLGL